MLKNGLASPAFRAPAPQQRQDQVRLEESLRTFDPGFPHFVQVVD